jgi:hypothetical protein
VTNTAKIGKGAAVPEQSSYQLIVTVKGADGAPLAAESVDEVRVTLRDVASDTIVNARDAVDMLGSGEASVDAGTLAIQFAPADMAAVGAAQFQQRRATLDVRLVGGARATHEVLFYVQALTDVS